MEGVNFIHDLGALPRSTAYPASEPRSPLYIGGIVTDYATEACGESTVLSEERNTSYFLPEFFLAFLSSSSSVEVLKKLILPITCFVL